MDVDKAKTDLKNVIGLLDYYKNKMEYLLYENERLKEENGKLLIDLAFYDGKLPKSTKGT
jgi:hypothetical protein